jgi:hypothetical protein
MMNEIICNAVESWSIGYDEVVDAFCCAPRGHAGPHHWKEA